LGAWKSPASKAEYARIVAELGIAPAPGALMKNPARPWTVNEVLLAFLRHADAHYRRPDGTPTSEPKEFRSSLRPVRILYGHTPAKEFGPLALAAVRRHMVEAGWSRKVVNMRVGRVKRCFKWAVSQELVPADVYVALSTVVGLQRGRTEAREKEPVGPVAESVVLRTLAHLPRHVAGMVRFQLATGCRPGEACMVRRCDVDESGPTWLYRPPHHKTSHRGQARVIPLGPKARTVLDEFPTDTPEGYVFCPVRCEADRNAEKSAGRTTPKWPSHLRRRKSKQHRSRPPGACYSTESYGRAVARGCELAFPLLDRLAPRDGESKSAWLGRLSDVDRVEVKAWRRTHHWHPNQIRHTVATRVRREYGLEAAQVLLGHAKADVTQIYAEKNQTLAAEVAALVG
jgi:integrase